MTIMSFLVCYGYACMYVVYYKKLRIQVYVVALNFSQKLGTITKSQLLYEFVSRYIALP